MNRFIYMFLLLVFGTTMAFSQSKLQIAKDHIRQAATEFQLTNSDIADYTLSSTSQSKKSGVTHFYFVQRHQGIDVYNAVLNVHVTKDDKILTSRSTFISNLAEKANAAAPSINAVQALRAASTALGYESAGNFSVLQDLGGIANEMLLSQGDIATEPIPAKLMYQPTEDGAVKLAWDFFIKSDESADWWSVRMDANTGEMLNKHNATIYCQFDDGMHDHAAHAHKATAPAVPLAEENMMMGGSYLVFPLYVESPLHGGQSLEVNPADATASPFGWHDTNGAEGAESTLTIGNNVTAVDDINANNTPDGFSPDGGMDLNFNFPFDPTVRPTDNLDAHVTNLFYWNNVIHDVLYHYGFDEASGNFQENNYGNGGSGSDSVNADAADGSGTNNANFSTPADGSNPRMQMFLWSASKITINSPASIAETIGATAGAWTNNPSEGTFSGDIVLAEPLEACEELTNSNDIVGNIALVDRGNCEFGLKALNAENAGASAVIICNNVEGGAPSPGEGESGAQVTIPVFGLSMEDCNRIKANLPVNITGELFFIDSDMDNGIIVHEYGHGVSNRLTGGRTLSNCLSNEEQMGEGWSDVYGLLMTMNQGDQATDLRGIGTYVISGDKDAGDGIRRFPYTTDFSVNTHVFEDLNTIADPSETGSPHALGHVWATMLWDMTWALIAQNGYEQDIYNSESTAGNIVAINLITEGLKLQGCLPGFLIGRDAILAADEALYDGANTCTIWRAFAKRGLGEDAGEGLETPFGFVAGSSAEAADAINGFAVPADCPEVALAMDLANFTGEIQAQRNELKWTTLTESSVLDHIVERSADGQSGWIVVGTEKAIGMSTTPKSYTLFDETPLPTGYYRLRSTEYDGKENISEVVVLKRDVKPFGDVNIFPNPTEDAISIKLETERAENVELILRDALGQTIAVQSKNVREGINNITFDLTPYAAGIYYLTISNNQKDVVKRVVKN